MPDRIIGATALYLGLPLITRDSKSTGSNWLLPRVQGLPSMPLAG